MLGEAGVSFEPRTSRAGEIEALVGFLGAVVPPGGAVYLSAPITSGRRFSDWHSARTQLSREASDPHYRKAHVEEVVEPNRARARGVVNRLRAETGCVVIDPTAIQDFEGWVQDDYRVLWALVIERHATRVVFSDGWEHSNGCAYEFLVACRRRLPMVTELGVELGRREGVALLRAAVAELQTLSLDLNFLRWVVRECELVQESSQNGGVP